MNITINEEPVDFTLAGERHALDVFSGIEKWLCEQDLLVSDLGMNGKQIFLDDIKVWGVTPVEEMDSLDLIVLNQEDLSLKHYGVVISFFALFVEALDENNEKVLSELMEDFPSVAENLPSIVGVETGTQMKDYIVCAVKDSGLPHNLTNESLQKIKGDFSSMIRIFEGRTREILQPKDELKITRGVLISLLPEMEELSVNLQTGKDLEAMNFIIRVVELLQKVIRLIFFVKKADKQEDEVLSEFAASVTEILGQVEEAFVSDDSVLIGDLMEYELKPVLEGFPQVLNGI